MKLVIEIPKPCDPQTGKPTEREDWVQGVSEAALNGARAWMRGARLDTTPTLTIAGGES